MKKILLFALAATAFAACSDDNGSTTPPPPGASDKYQGGFYVYNEGSYGRTPASVNYYDKTTGEWSLNLYQENNEGEKLGNTGTVAVCSDDNVYFVSKETPWLVEVGLEDFLKKSALPDGALTGQAYGFALIDGKHGVLTTSEGAYSVSLDPLELGDAFFEGRGLGGDVAVKDGRVFLTASAGEGDVVNLHDIPLTASAGEGDVVKVYDASTLAFVKDLPAAAKTGFAEAGGMLWAAAGNKLFKINTTALTSEEVTLGDDLSVYYNQWAYTPTGLHASKKGDALYFVEGSSSGYDVYRFTIATGAAEKLFPAPEVDGTRYSVYGAGLNADPESDDLYLFYTADWGGHATIYVVDGTTGEQKKSFPYTDAEYWFPSMILFR